GDGQHERPSSPDVVHVPLDDPEVDDVGVEVRQVKVAERLSRQQRHDHPNLTQVPAQVGSQQAGQHGSSVVGCCSPELGILASWKARWRAASPSATTTSSSSDNGCNRWPIACWANAVHSAIWPAPSGVMQSRTRRLSRESLSLRTTPWAARPLMSIDTRLLGRPVSRATSLRVTPGCSEIPSQLHILLAELSLHAAQQGEDVFLSLRAARLSACFSRAARFERNVHEE